MATNVFFSQAANAEHVEGTIKTQGTRPLGEWPT